MAVCILDKMESQTCHKLGKVFLTVLSGGVLYEHPVFD